tara:strand:+ start:280 stop:1317 length:1038 start_codon:yes stop_codon:yes gene_type:complete
MDYTTGAVLFEKNSRVPVPPASLSKLMTSYMVFDALRLGIITLDDLLTVSEKAWRMGGSKMFVEVDKQVSVHDLLRGVIVQSGNDACIVLAEAIGGDEASFADLMNEKASDIGMLDSLFQNSTGWPHPEHKMSAADIALITQKIVEDFPDYFPLFAEKEFTYNEIRQANRNPLLYKDIGVDGMKTGHTREAGYGLAATALRNDRRLIAVVTGLDSPSQRASEVERLLNYGFRQFENYNLFSAGEVVLNGDVWLGKLPKVSLVIENELIISLQRNLRDKLRVTVQYDSPIPAPVSAGMELGKLFVEAPDFKTIEIPLVAQESVMLAGPIGRLKGAINYMVFGAPND